MSLGGNTNRIFETLAHAYVCDHAEMYFASRKSFKQRVARIGDEDLRLEESPPHCQTPAVLLADSKACLSRGTSESGFFRSTENTVSGYDADQPL
jgi:hypothetical protein